MPRNISNISNVNRANYDSSVPTPWVNAGGSSILGGSWWDAAYTANGSAPWATQTVTDTDTVKPVNFDVTTLFQAIYDNPTHLSAVIIGATGGGTFTYIAGNGYTVDTAKRPKINYDGGADQSVNNDTGINWSSFGGSPNAAEQIIGPDLGTTLNWGRHIIDVPPPVTRPTSATLKLYTTQQFGVLDLKVFWLRYPPESAPTIPYGVRITWAESQYQSSGVSPSTDYSEPLSRGIFRGIERGVA